MYITISFSQVWKAALNLQSVFKTYLKVLWSSCFRGDGRKKNSWGHLNTDLYFAQAFSQDLKSGRPKYTIGPAQMKNSLQV